MSRGILPNPDFYVHGHNTQHLQGRVISVIDEPRGPKGEPPKMRVKVRLYGVQDDTSRIPDDQLQWYDVQLPVNSQGRSPYMKPGMSVMVSNYGGAAGSLTSAYVTGIMDWYPQTPSMQGEEKEFKVARNEDYPPPGKE